MFRQLQIGAFLKINRRQAVVYVLLFWFVFAGLMLLEEKITWAIAGRPSDPVDQWQYIIRFTLWTLLTPAIMALAIRFPLRRQYFFVDFARHFLLALLLIALEFCVEIPLVRALTSHLQGAAPPVLEYAVVFILKLNIYLLLYFVIVGVTWFMLHAEHSKRTALFAKEAELKAEQLETQLAEAQLSLLKMQLDPHFLFNTHHAIISLMLSGENDKAVRMLTRLSDLLRLSLEEGEHTINLEKEVRILRLYLEIQEIRFQERLRVSIELDADTLALKVPAFILQPIVENAIRHGFSPSAEAGSIQIHSGIAGDQFFIRIQNDGPRIDFEHFREGIGIANTRARLQGLYGDRAAFVLENQPATGVLAILYIPIA